MSSRTVRRWTLAATTLAVLACAHAKTTDAQRPAPDEPANEVAGPAAAKSAADPDRTQAVSTGRGRNKTPVAARPEGLLKPCAEQKIRDKLSEGGLFKEERTSTEAALRRFQSSHDLPTTGIPDHETIRKLGLNPDDVFHKATP